jgi:hypothetical protein
VVRLFSGKRFIGVKRNEGARYRKNAGEKAKRKGVT